MVKITDKNKSDNAEFEELSALGLSISDLLDDQCQSSNIDELLVDPQADEALYRYQTVSNILRNQQSEMATSLFCQQVSDKIAPEPAIIAAPAVNAKVSNSKMNSNIIPFKKIGGGFAIAASAAFATFFSVQTLQIADKGQMIESSTTIAKVEDPASSRVNVEIVDSLEQTELEFSSEAFRYGAWRSGNVDVKQVSGSFVKTIRFSAEQWQEMLDRAAQRQAERKSLEETAAPNSDN